MAALRITAAACCLCVLSWWSRGARCGPLPPSLSGMRPLSELVGHMEPALYDRRVLLQAAAARTRRAAGDEFSARRELRLDVTTHGRTYRLRLRPEQSLFAEDAVLESTGGPVHFDVRRVLSGTLEDDDRAVVRGVATADGLFDGHVWTPGGGAPDLLYIEPASRYLPAGAAAPQRLHSVAHRSSAVRGVRAPAPCASHLLHRRRQVNRDGENNSTAGSSPQEDLKGNSLFSQVNSTIHSMDYNDIGLETMFSPSNQYSERTNMQETAYRERANFLSDVYDENFYDKMNIQSVSNEQQSVVNKVPKSETTNPEGDQDLPSNLKVIYNVTSSTNRYDNRAHSRQRRWLPDLEIDLMPRTEDSQESPPLRRRILGDSLVPIFPEKTTCMLYLQADHLFFQKYGTVEACIEVMTHHVQRVNDIYSVTDFNRDGKPDGIRFMIKRIKVHTTDALKDPAYRFPLNYGVEKFLELFSEEDYDAFCLAYMFTYRDFEMGTLGLAWTGDLKNAGGVCEKNGHYRGSMKSLNTGIVTLLNYGKHVPPAVSHVTLAHEIGHNFGSPHDPDSCTPGGEDGNYIMFARATSGDKKNNNKFSPCSIDSIDPVLRLKGRSNIGCFTEQKWSLCGNGVVEVDEECDCGWEEDCHDPCCYPQRTVPSKEAPACTLTPGSECSPSKGPCCTSDCQLKFGDKCREDNGCRDASFCRGYTANCPPSSYKPNKTICNEEFVCFLGECTGSICLAYGLESCQCRPGPNDKKTKACELCCKQPGENQPCLSSFEWNQYPYDVPDMYSKPGTPCNDYNGYCDVFQKCREVDPSGPLATLRKLLLSEESIASFKQWVMQYWYAVLFIVIGVVLLMVAIAKLLGKRPTLKKLKQVTIIHSSTTETVRLPPEGADGAPATVQHPTAVRPKLPLKRRVREGVTSGTGAASRTHKKKTTHLSSKGKRRRKKVVAPDEQKTEKRLGHIDKRVEKKTLGEDKRKTGLKRPTESEKQRNNLVDKKLMKTENKEDIVVKDKHKTDENTFIEKDKSSGDISCAGEESNSHTDTQAVLKAKEKSTGIRINKQGLESAMHNIQPLTADTANEETVFKPPEKRPRIAKQMSEVMDSGIALSRDKRRSLQLVSRSQGKQLVADIASNVQHLRDSKQISLEQLPMTDDVSKPFERLDQPNISGKQNKLEKIEKEDTNNQNLDVSAVETVGILEQKLPGKRQSLGRPLSVDSNRQAAQPTGANVTSPSVSGPSKTHEAGAFTRRNTLGNIPSMSEKPSRPVAEKRAVVENPPVVAIIPDRQHISAEKKRTGADRRRPSSPPDRRKGPDGKRGSLEKKTTHRTRPKTEVIDYSTQQVDTTPQSTLPGAVPATENDPVNKVKNWLMTSQQHVSRSRSTPAGLTEKTATVGRSGSGTDLKPPEGGKAQLQVLYRSPFKFKLKFKKPNTPVAASAGAGTKGGRTALLVRQRRGAHGVGGRRGTATLRPAVSPELALAADDMDSNLHTIPSDLEVLLSESEFLFSEDGA